MYGELQPSLDKLRDVDWDSDWNRNAFPKMLIDTEALRKINLHVKAAN